MSDPNETPLSRLSLLFLDCQTTGMRPTTGSLLELGWAWRRGGLYSPIEAKLVRLPEGEDLSAKTMEITGLREADMAAALEDADVHRLVMEGAPPDGPVLGIAHYAQFETAFLRHFFGKVTGAEGLPFEMLCTQQLAKRLLPHLPSHNIRALAGYFGHPVEELNRAAPHVEATILIWRSLESELRARGLETLGGLRAWMKAPIAKAPRYEYHMDRLKRLSLPKQPGIYRMLSKTGQVLYVGKATSLKDRVNSYFRGKKGRDPRKLEMLAQVWDLETVVCGSILEASLLENDEIKRLDPPYNVSLKTGQRQLLFYSRDYEDVATEEDDEHPIGPLRPFNHVEQLRRLQFSLEGGSFAGIFYVEIDEQILREGFRLFLERESLTWDVFLDLRSAMAVSLMLYRRHRKEAALLEEMAALDEDAGLEGDNADPPEPDDGNDEPGTETAGEDEPPTPEEIADKFGRMFLRAGAENRRLRELTKLLNADIRFETRDGWRTLRFRRGQWRGLPAFVETPETPAAGPLSKAWKDLTIEDYDRMCVLLSEISKLPHEVDDRRP